MNYLKKFILSRNFSLTAEFHILKFFGSAFIHQRSHQRNIRRNETFLCIHW